MNYKVYGNKENIPFLILHGWGGSSKSWEKVTKKLANNFYVIVPDIPCASKLVSCDKIYTLDDYTKLVKELVDKLNFTNFILMGHSNGGAIATKFVVNYPDVKIKKLILNNSAGIRKTIRKNLKRKIFGFIAKVVKPISSLPGIQNLRILFYKAIGGQDYLEAEKNLNKKQTYLNMINSDLQNIFPKINKDTLIIWGENDTYTPLEDGEKIHKFIKNSKLVVIKNVKHGIHLQKPDELVKVILENL